MVLYINLFILLNYDYTLCFKELLLLCAGIGSVLSIGKKNIRNISKPHVSFDTCGPLYFFIQTKSGALAKCCGVVQRWECHLLNVIGPIV